jgi:formylglycine-generating enzyme required for sulfatase activity
MTLVCVTAGEFLMGSDNSDALAVDNEKPQHRVYLDAFWIDRTEVTNGMYKRCVSDRKCSAPPSSVYGLRGAYYGNSIYENYPVVNVSWNDANAYCGWAGRKLPSEAQWEKAARGPDGRLYPWGNTFPTGSLLNYNFNEGFLMPVGSYLGGESPYGALDMAGNVFEWVGDYYSSGTYSSSPASNPTGPTSGTNRVLRGGSWNFNSKYVRAAFRHWYNPLSAGYDVGFRCASMP